MVNRSFETILLVGLNEWRLEAKASRLLPSAKIKFLDARALFQTSGTVPDIEENQHDLVIAPLILHWSNNPLRELSMFHKALKSDGLFLAAVPGDGTLSALRAALIAAEAKHRDGAAQRVDPFPSVQQIGGLLQRTGFALPVIDQEQVEVRYSGLETIAYDLRAVGATNALNGQRPPLTKTIWQDVERHYPVENIDGKRKIPATFSFIFMSGWVPHESQQQPLKPGSGKISLADALSPSPPAKSK
ncbi:MAG: SAM-dependent methyltransferase [Pseudomonadota bacterium]